MSQTPPLRVEVSSTLARLLDQEDTDRDAAITIADHGPKRFELQGIDGRKAGVRGTYALSNLLQELALQGRGQLTLDLDSLNEPAPQRIGKAIRERYWSELTRRMDHRSLATVLSDPKGDGVPRLYLPRSDRRSWEYYSQLRDSDYQRLPLDLPLTRRDSLALNSAPGLLGLAFDTAGEPLPYVVPGGRFNEMYGWDSYFIGLGLVADSKVELARAMVDHMVYQIDWYGAILNANRTYYLTRSQPPFLTSFLRLLADRVNDPDWIERVLRACAREYETVWMGPDRRLSHGLSRYFCRGVGYPPETLPRHYGQIMAPFAHDHGMTVEEFRRAYLAREVAPPELDDYFQEDRAVRESGHDTSYRLEGICTRLATVDLNSLLYRYEKDIAELLDRWFSGALEGLPSSQSWRERAAARSRLMTKLCWTSEGFFDHDVRQGAPTGFGSATNLYPLWAGLASAEQASLMVEKVLPKLIEAGGVVGGTESSRGALSARRTARQWDFPYGWAPHQMLLWQGLRDYGYEELAGELAYRWTRMLTQCAIDYNGVLAEKYDLVGCSHEVFAEYANQGAHVRYVPREGFGWTNASYQIGLTLLSDSQRRTLDSLQASDQL